MSIWYDGDELNMYRGDSGQLLFSGLPGCTGYRVFFSVKSIKTKEIVFESAGDPEYYYLNNDGEEYIKPDDELEFDFIKRMERLVENGEATKKARCKIFISPDQSEKLFVLKTQEKNEYNYGLKICFSYNGVENTIIPKTKIDEETGEIIFEEAPKFIVRQKYVEGIMPCEEYDAFDSVITDPKTYGLQPLLIPTVYVSINDKNEISFSDAWIEKFNDVIDDVAVIESKIPEEASPENQLADKQFVKDEIDEALEKATVFKGIVDNQTLLPSEGNTNGDMYWIRKFVEPVPPGMKEGHTGVAIFNGQTQEWDYEADEVFDPDEKTIILNNDGRLQVQLSNVEGNDLEAKDDGLYISLGSIETALQNEIDRATTAEATLQTNIDAEATTRATADTTLQTNIDTEATTRATADTTLQTNIDTEATTRETADTTLQTNIDTVATNLSSEVTRATAAESTLQTNIDTEATTRETADTALQTNIDTVATNLASEVSRATTAEGTLQTNIDTVATNLASEVSRATTAESTLQTNIDTEATTRATADTTLQTNIDTVATNLSSEVTRATTAETTLQTNIDTEATTRATADTTLQTNINTVATDLASEVSRATTAEGTLQTNIDTEATTRATADTVLEGQIETEATTRASADTTLQENINDEATTRASADTTLQENINAETTRATTVEGTLSNLTTDTKTDLVSAINELNSSKQENLTEGTGIDITNNVVSLDAVLDNLNDVSITDATNNDFLLFNSLLSKWVNFQLTEIDGGHAGSGPVPPPTEDIDGGDSSTETFDETIDNGDSSTEVFDEIIDGGNSGENHPTQDGGNSSSVPTSTVNNGDASTDSFDDTLNGGDSSNS